MNWEPKENFVISFSDETGDERTKDQFDEMVGRMSSVANEYGFDKDSWGGNDAMFVDIRQRVILKRGNLIDQIVKLDSAFSVHLDLLERLSIETLMDLESELQIRNKQ